MELDPKPDEYLIANARAQPHACSFPPAHTHTSSQDVVLCFKRASAFLPMMDWLLQDSIMWFVFLMTF